VKAVWQGRVAQTAAKYSDNAPMATVCCNACRTCVTTNGISLALAAVVGVGAAAAKLGRRLYAKPSWSNANTAEKASGSDGSL
jgi:hypothetical protein